MQSRIRAEPRALSPTTVRVCLFPPASSALSPLRVGPLHDMMVHLRYRAHAGWWPSGPLRLLPSAFLPATASAAATTAVWVAHPLGSGASGAARELFGPFMKMKCPTCRSSRAFGTPLESTERFAAWGKNRCCSRRHRASEPRDGLRRAPGGAQLPPTTPDWLRVTMPCGLPGRGGARRPSRRHRL